MRRLARPAIALSLGATAVLGGAATAAPAKVACNIIEDEKGDTFLYRTVDEPGEYGPQEDRADIVSGDVASDGKVITGVIRVVNLAATAATSPYGVAYDINFTAPSVTPSLFMRATVTAAGTTVSQAGTRERLPAVTSLSTVLASGTAVVDLKQNEVRFSFPLSTWSGVGGIKKGDRLSFGDITTGRATGDSRAVFMDVTTNSKPYKVGDRSCVAPGK